MGGLTVLYALTVSDRFDEETRAKMPPIHGAFAMCPLLDGEDSDVLQLPWKLSVTDS